MPSLSNSVLPQVKRVIATDDHAALRKVASISVLLLLCATVVASATWVVGGWLGREREIDDLRARVRQLALRPPSAANDVAVGVAFSWPARLRATDVDEAHRHLQQQLKAAAAGEGIQLEVVRTLPEASRAGLAEARAAFTIKAVPADSVSVLVARFERATPPILIETLRIVGRRTPGRGSPGQPAVSAASSKVDLSATVAIPLVAGVRREPEAAKP